MADPKKITLEEAKTVLAEGDFIHVFREDGDIEGAHWHKERVLKSLEQFGAHLSGDVGRKYRHGICTFDGKLWTFFETKKPPEIK